MMHSVSDNAEEIQERSTEMLLGLMAPVVAEDDSFDDSTFIPPRSRPWLRVAVVLGIVVLAGGAIAAGLHLFPSGWSLATATNGHSDGDDVRVTWCVEPRPSARRGRTLRSRATKARKRSLRRARARARRHLSAARQALQRRNWKAARREARRALRVDHRRRTRRQASAIQRRARAGAVRQHKVTRYLINARRALRSKQWSKAKSRASRALRLDPKNRRARSIKRLAEAKLRQGRRRRG